MFNMLKSLSVKNVEYTQGSKEPPIIKNQASSRLLVVTQNLPPTICGVGDYATLFARELCRQLPGLEVTFLTRTDGIEVKHTETWLEEDFLSKAQIYPVAPMYWRVRDLPAMLRVVRQSQASMVHLHYVPHMYYRAGVGVAVSLFGLLLRLLGFRLIVTFHECYIPWSWRPKELTIGIIQRLSFFLLLLATQEIVVTTGLRARLLQNWLFWDRAKAKKIVISPVGSNFPGVEQSPEEVKVLREKWKLPQDGLILTNLGHLRWQEQDKWLLATLDGVQHDRPEACLLMLGCRSQDLPVGHPLTGRKDVIFTGYLSATEISGLLAQSDIYLLILNDGISGRRTALMAGLQQGRAIVATMGHNTEAEFIERMPVLLAHTTEQISFVRLTRELSANQEHRKTLGKEAARRYQESFSWPVIVQQQKHLFERQVKQTSITQKIHA